MNRSRICYIHIGTPKTGTTSLQGFLAANRAAFAAAGVFIPSSAGTGDPEFACHHGIVSGLLGEPRPSTGELAEVTAELGASTAPRACLSSENISLLYDRPDLLSALSDAVNASGFAPVIVSYVRPQASYAVAIFALNVLNGDRTAFDRFLADVLRDGRYRWTAGYGPDFDYARLLDGFAHAFAGAPIIVRPFSSDAADAALHRSFTNIIAPGLTFEALTVPSKRANRTLTFGAVLERLGMAKRFDEHLRFAPLQLPDLARIAARFSEPNRRLASLYGVRLPAFEPLDFVRALPIRRSPLLTRELAQARRALREPRRTVEHDAQALRLIEDERDRRIIAEREGGELASGEALRSALRKEFEDWSPPRPTVRPKHPRG